MLVSFQFFVIHFLGYSDFIDLADMILLPSV